MSALDASDIRFFNCSAEQTGPVFASVKSCRTRWRGRCVRWRCDPPGSSSPPRLLGDGGPLPSVVFPDAPFDPTLLSWDPVLAAHLAPQLLPERQSNIPYSCLNVRGCADRHGLIRPYHCILFLLLGGVVDPTGEPTGKTRGTSTTGKGVHGGFRVGQVWPGQDSVPRTTSVVGPEVDMPRRYCIRGHGRDPVRPGRG
jgi:hypothetical protein